MRQWYFYWNSIGQQALAQLEKQKLFQIPWGHHILIITKIKEKKEAIFYVCKTIENNWYINLQI